MLCLKFRQYYLKLLITMIDLKKKYKFKKDFDFSLKMNALWQNVELLQQMIEKNPRLSTMKKELIEIKKQSNQLLECLQKTSFKAKQCLTDAFAKGVDGGYGRFMSESINWSVSQFESDLQSFDSICMYAIDRFLDDKGGQVSGSLSKYIIFRLAAIYHHGTLNVPTCGWDDLSNPGCYRGDFYNFLVESKYFVPRYLGTDQTIGKYAVEVLRIYKDEVRNRELIDGKVD